MDAEPDRFWKCPGCGERTGSYSTAMERAGRSNGTGYRVRIGEQHAAAIETAKGDPQAIERDPTGGRKPLGHAFAGAVSGDS